MLAIVPLAALLSRATEFVASKTGDTVGGLLNATLGNLTELVIALTALAAGQYMLVKASIAGAIVANTLFLLGASFLLGGLKHRVQEFNRTNARLQTTLLFLATVAMLMSVRARMALATLAGVTVLVALVSEVFVEFVQEAAVTFGRTPAFVGFIVVALVGGAAEMASAFSGARRTGWI